MPPPSKEEMEANALKNAEDRLYTKFVVPLQRLMRHDTMIKDRNEFNKVKDLMREARELMDKDPHARGYLNAYLGMVVIVKKLIEYFILRI